MKALYCMWVLGVEVAQERTDNSYRKRSVVCTEISSGKDKVARTGCLKKPCGKKLPACGENLELRRGVYGRSLTVSSIGHWGCVIEFGFWQSVGLCLLASIVLGPSWFDHVGVWFQVLSWGHWSLYDQPGSCERSGFF